MGLGRASWGRVSGTIEVGFTVPFEPDLVWPALDFGFAEAAEWLWWCLCHCRGD